ncbi:DUF5710 domain-containing protein [Aquipseudomonas alcaligenes]|uniref:DUF5710 domain-containing protein n=1 Tax=Aquipseudomonas alcaligenes TaxID=43263 RepID=UPI0030138C71
MAFHVMRIRLGLEAQAYQREKKEPVIWDTSLLVNAHTLLCGMSGSGKTFTLRKMISHMLQTCDNEVPRIHVFDVHGDIDIPGASTVRFSERTNYGLNPLRVNPDPHFGGVRKRIQQFMGTMNKVMFRLGPKQEACLRNVLLDVYTAHGFKINDPDTWVVNSDTPVLLTDGDQNKLFLDVPRGQKDEAKALGAKWSGDPIYSWWIPANQYEGAITQWPPKLVGRTHPSINDALRLAQNILTSNFLGTGAEAVTYLEVANKAAAAYQRKLLAALRKGQNHIEDEQLTSDLEKAKQKAIDSFTTYANAIATGAELSTLMKYDSLDVLKSVVDRLSNLDAIGVFKSVPPPFDPAAAVWRYNLHALSLQERKLFVLFKLEEIFMAAVQRGQQEYVRDVLILDEAHIYSDGSEDNIIGTIAKEGRKFGLGVVAASQSPTHFDDDFVASVGTKIILGIDEVFWKGAATKMRLKEEALAWVNAQVTMMVQFKMKGETKNDWIWTVIA